MRKAKPCDSPALKREGTWIPGKAGKTKRLPCEEFLRSLIMGTELRAKALPPPMRICFTRWRGSAITPISLPGSPTLTGEADQQSIEEMIRLARQIWKEVKKQLVTDRTDSRAAKLWFPQEHGRELRPGATWWPTPVWIPVHRLDVSLEYTLDEKKASRSQQEASLREAVDEALNQDQTERDLFRPLWAALWNRPLKICA